MKMWKIQNWLRYTLLRRKRPMVQFIISDTFSATTGEPIFSKDAILLITTLTAPTGPSAVADITWIEK